MTVKLVLEAVYVTFALQLFCSDDVKLSDMAKVWQEKARWDET